jgi:cobalt-zinc-cadmium resistance protein CzcA
MIRKLVHFALKQRVLTILLALVIVVGGVVAYLTIKIEAYPDIADTEVDVITKYPGRAASEVEQQITVPIERALNSVPRVVNRRSRTIFGLSIVKLTFEEGTDDYFARQQVIEKLRDADLPDGISTELAPLSTPVGELYRYVLEGKAGFSPMDIRTLHDWVVVPKLLQAKGVADVVNFGGLVKQFTVILDPLKLRKYGLTVSQVQAAIQANNSNSGGNVIERGSQGLSIRVIGRITTSSDIESIVLPMPSNLATPLFIRDIGTVEITALPPSGILGYIDNSRKHEENNGVEGIVLMRRGENPSEVLESLKEKIEEAKTALPEGVDIKMIYDRSELVENTLHTVSHTLIEGVTIVVLILLLFLGNIRASIITAITIPLSLLWAFIVMRFVGIPANLLSLGAIDFGIIVDGAVIMTESILRNLSHKSEEEKREKGTLRIIVEATQEVDREIFFSVVIIILAYLPLFTLTRVEGKLFSPMAYTLSFAIGGSLLLALTLVPVLSTYFFRLPKLREWKNPFVRWIERAYAAMLDKLLRLRVIVIAGALAIVVGVMYIGTKIGTEFLPELDEGAIVIRTVLPAGISLGESVKYPPMIREVIASFPEVRAVITQLGRNDDGTDPYGPNRIETHAELTKYSTWPNEMDKHKLLKELKTALENKIPGALFSFSQPILDNVTEAVTGSSADLAILVNGNDLKTLRNCADSIYRIVRTIPGASESGIEQEEDQAQLKIEVDRAEAARYGINVRDIEDLIELAVAGKPVSTLYDGERKFDIVVRYQAIARSTVEDISKLDLASPSGQHVLLSDVARIVIEDGATIIAREDGHRQIGVRTNIRERDQGSFVAEAQQKVGAALHLPAGYSIDWGGQFENLTRAKKHYLIIVPITLFLIFGLLFITFKSVKYALIVLVNVPLALVGGISALMLRGMNFSVSSGVGFVSLFGVAVMSGVLLVSRFNQLRFEKHIPLRDAVFQGAVEELRPILMMMLVALLGLIPASLASGIGSDVQRPLATVIVGGLASALVLTLLVIPVLYYMIEKRSHEDAMRLVVVEVEEYYEQHKIPESDKLHHSHEKEEETNLSEEDNSKHEQVSRESDKID